MPNSENEGSKRIGILIPEDVYDIGKAMAKRDRRSFSNYVATLIERAASQIQPPVNRAENAEKEAA